jgi:hypothetical protein
MSDNKHFVTTWENKIVINLLNYSAFSLHKKIKTITFYNTNGDEDPDNWEFQSEERTEEVYGALLEKFTVYL